MDSTASGRRTAIALSAADGVDRIQEQLLTLPGTGLVAVELDLSGVPSVDSGILGAVLMLRQALADEGCRLVLSGCSEPWLSALQLLRMERLLCMDRQSR
ncbi:MAG: STAS domain-containing protein [Spirochaetales bacterium]|nr:STAS domain-containing protein [Spirochaetales bacterium]